MSPKIVTRALANPVQPGICTTNDALGSSNKFLNRQAKGKHLHECLQGKNSSDKGSAH
jgi:hypothetical protein